MAAPWMNYPDSSASRTKISMTIEDSTAQLLSLLEGLEKHIKASDKHALGTPSFVGNEVPEYNQVTDQQRDERCTEAETPYMRLYGSHGNSPDMQGYRRMSNIPLNRGDQHRRRGESCPEEKNIFESNHGNLGNRYGTQGYTKTSKVALSRGDHHRKRGESCPREKNSGERRYGGLTYTYETGGQRKTLQIPLNDGNQHRKPEERVHEEKITDSRLYRIPGYSYPYTQGSARTLSNANLSQECRGTSKISLIDGTQGHRKASKIALNDVNQHGKRDARYLRKEYATRYSGNRGCSRNSPTVVGDGEQYKVYSTEPAANQVPTKIAETSHQSDQRQSSVDKDSTEQLKEPCSYVDFSQTYPEVKWHRGISNLIPQNATKIGYTKTGTPLYAGRAWDKERTYLVPAYMNFEEGKCYYGQDGYALSSLTYEVMECKHVAWDDAKGVRVTELPKFAYQVGYNERDEPLYFGRAYIDGSITPGYVEGVSAPDSPTNRVFSLVIPFRGNVMRVYNTYEVMVIIPDHKQ